MRFDSFAAFSDAAHALAPSSMRLLLKYRNSPGALVLKATDADKTVRFHTAEKDDLRHMDKLALWVLTEAVAPLSPAEAAAAEARGASAPAAVTATAGGAAVARKGGVARAGTSGSQRRKAIAARAAAEGRVAPKSASARRKDARRAAALERRAARVAGRRMVAAAADIAGITLG